MNELARHTINSIVKAEANCDGYIIYIQSSELQVDSITFNQIVNIVNNLRGMNDFPIHELSGEITNAKT